MADEWLSGLSANLVTVLDLDMSTNPDLASGPLAGVVVATVRGRWPTRVPAAVDVVLTDGPATDRAAVRVPDVDAAVADIRERAHQWPRAALSLVLLLRQTELLPVSSGLAAESAVYSTLLAGPEFAAWQASRPVRTVPDVADPVLLSRDGDVLTVTLNRADRRNAFGSAVRDGLIDALDLVLVDDSIAEVRLRGAGPAFCSGGDLDEFGRAPDVATAHVVRLDRSAGARLHACRDRVTALVHGACIGAGVEIPAFAHRVVAAPDAVFQLPEVGMGLIPGAGGTVSLTRRIGRHRTAYLALTGARLDAGRALEWGLVDAVG